MIVEETHNLPQLSVKFKNKKQPLHKKPTETLHIRPLRFFMGNYSHLISSFPEKR